MTVEEMNARGTARELLAAAESEVEYWRQVREAALARLAEEPFWDKAVIATAIAEARVFVDAIDVARREGRGERG